MAKQHWSPGAIVRVGFLKYQAIAKVPTPGDWLPDQWVLSSGKAFYRFTPHNGVERISEAEASDMVRASLAIAERKSLEALEQVQQAAVHASVSAALLARGRL